MSTYSPPLREIRFTLREIAGLESLLSQSPGGVDMLATTDAILEQAARFATGVLAPLNSLGDREGCRLENGRVHVPEGFAAAYRRYVEAGWNTLQFPPELGGQGLPVTMAVALAEIFNAANTALSMGTMPFGGAVTLIHRFGTERQKRLYLPQLVSGEWTVTMAITEAQAGTDVGAITTQATPNGGAYGIRGQKTLISFGAHDMTENIVHLLLARSPQGPEGVKGLSLYIVPQRRVHDDGRLGERNDIICIALEHKMGLRGSPTATLVFGDQGEAYGELLGSENKGIEQMFILMNRARLNVGVFGLASAERAHQAALAYAQQRVQGRGPDGRPVAIIHHPDVRRMLLSMVSRTEAARAIAYYTAALIDRAALSSEANAGAATRRRIDLLTPLTKAWCTETAFDVTSLGVQIFGGIGYSEECEGSQHFRDARVHMIYEGTTAVHANDLIFRKIQRDGGTAAYELFSEIRTTLQRAEECEDSDLVGSASILRAALEVIEHLTEWMTARAGEDPRPLQANAVHYLMLFGAVVGGWLMVRAALAATVAPEPWGERFVSRKIRHARFFLEQVVRTAMAMASTIKEGAEPILCDDEFVD